MALRSEYGLNEGTGTTSANTGTGGSSLTLGTATWVTPGHGGSAACIQTTGAQQSSISPFGTSGTAWSLMAWVRATASTGGYQTIFTGLAGFVELDGSMNLNWYHGNGGNIADGPMAVGTWTHVAITSDGTTRKLYKDGALVGSVAAALPYSTEAIVIGGGDGSGGLRFDDIRAWDQALTQAEVQAFMAAWIGGAAPTPSGGSTAAVSVSATGGGRRLARRGSTATVTVAASGSGRAEHTGAGGSTATTAVTSAGSGRTLRRGGATASVAAAASGAGANPAGHRWPTAVSGRHFVDQDGAPWMLRGDSPWSAFTDLSPAQWETWCSTRAEQGFNAAIVSAIGATDNGAPSDNGATYDGILPFIGGDITQPNETYWARMDQFFDIAEEHGITLLFYVMDGWNSPNTASGKVFSGKSTTDCDTYGRFLGTRYGDRQNLIWMVGGDYFPVTNDPAEGSVVDLRFWACLTGCKATETRTHLVSIQLGYNRSWSTQNPFWAGKVDWNFVYTYYPTYEGVRAARAASTLPGPFSEGHYEGGTHSLAPSAAAVRRQAGWAYSSGSPGDIFGTNDWKFETGWETRLALPGTLAVTNIRQHVAALDGWQNLAPAPGLITSGAGTPYTWTGEDYPDTDIMLDTYATAAATPDGGLAVVYLPTSRAITLGSGLGDSPQGEWLNPTTGATQAATLGGTITPPASGDWLLTITATPTVDVRSGGSTAGVGAGATGAGRKVARAGGTTSVVTSATGLARKLAAAGTVATVITTAAGAGIVVMTGRGGSVASVGAVATGSGSPIMAGGSTATVAATATGGGRNPAGPDDIELTITRGPYGTSFTLSQPRR